jgi:hypothetical protein
MHRIIILKFKIENRKWNINICKKAPNGFNSTQIIYLLDAKKVSDFHGFEPVPLRHLTITTMP